MRTYLQKKTHTKTTKAQSAEYPRSARKQRQTKNKHVANLKRENDRQTIHTWTTKWTGDKTE